MRRKPTVIEIIFCAAGLAVGFGLGAMPSAHAVQKESVEYRTIETNRISTLEKELNEAAKEGCKVILRVGGDYALVLECPS